METSIVYKGLYRDNWFSFPLARDTEAPRSYELELGMGTAPMINLWVARCCKGVGYS